MTRDKVIKAVQEAAGEYDNIFAERMAAADGSDTEDAHGRADDLLVELLRELGFEKTTSAYEKIYKWYA